MNGKICYIIGASEFNETITPQNGDYIIAADGGYKELCKRGITADAVLGDFDSLGYIPKHSNLVTFPSEKDDTDTALALKLGYDKGYRKFLIFGGMGGRLDHTLANMQTILGFCRRGAECYLIGDKSIITVIENTAISFSGKERGYFSLFAADGTAEGVSTKNAKYQLNNDAVYADRTRTVSNEFTALPLSIETHGALYVLWYEDFKDKEGSIYENKRSNI